MPYLWIALKELLSPDSSRGFFYLYPYLVTALTPLSNETIY